MRAALALVLTIAACEPPPGAAEAGKAAGPPAALCSAARDGLDRAAATGALHYRTGTGRASVDEPAWAQLDWSAKRDLAKMLAYESACPDGDPNDAMVTIRSRRTNRVLASGTYASFAER